MLSVGGDRGEFVVSEVLVVHVVRHILEVLHVCSYQHVPQRDEVVVLQVLNCKKNGKISVNAEMFKGRPPE